ncbi:MAG: polysaccharide biosynthesis/export family protein [Bryobacterales bacterium]
MARTPFPSCFAAVLSSCRAFALLGALLVCFNAASSAQELTETLGADVPGLDEVLARGETEAEEYVIGVGDILSINVWKEPDVSVEQVGVRSDGKISVPLVKEVFASGLTPMQLEDILTQKLRQYINNPVVTVIVLEVRSQRVFIVGNVGASGMLPLEPGLTAMRAIALAGGLTEFAKRKKIYVLREVAGKPQKIPFDYSGVLSGETPEADIELKPGDTIFVP